MLSTTSVPVVQFFVISVLEVRDIAIHSPPRLTPIFSQHVILTGWGRLADADKLQLRNALLEMLQARHATLERYVLNKLCKAIADVGKQEWPRRFPELLPMTQQLVQRPESAGPGLILLKTIVEEFSSSREDIPATRRLS